MDFSRRLLRSRIITGSDFNYRTFSDDESLISIESTVLAGNVTMDDKTRDTEKSDDLSTVNEETHTESLSVDSADDVVDLLNMNIDAIEDNDVFFDCPSFSPIDSPKKPRKSPVYRTVNVKNGKLLTISSSGISSSEERTGSMLAQMMNDLNDLKDNVTHSTPKIDTNNDSNEFNISSTRKISFSSEGNLQEQSLFEDIRSKNKRTCSPGWKAVKRVAKMREFFEGKANHPAMDNQTSKALSVKIVKTSGGKRVSSKRPTYKTMAVPKLTVSSFTASISPKASSNNSLLRPSSCSDYQSENVEESDSMSNSFRPRSHSDSDVRNEANCSYSQFNRRLKKAVKRNAVTTRRPYFVVSKKVTLPAASNQSQIRNRRSIENVALMAKSPIKPVRVLRQVFSPSMKNND